MGARIDSYRRGKVIKKLADDLDFIYFGKIDRNADEYLPVYGLSASMSHSDNHYVAGTFKDYDVRIVDRNDLHQDSEHKFVHYQVIVEVGLKSHVCRNPSVVLAKGHEHAYLTKIELLKTFHKVDVDAHKSFSEFLLRYDVYSKSYALNCYDEWLSVNVQKAMSTEAWPLSFEIDDKNKVYIYLTGKDLSKNHLEKALEMAVWLAYQIDSASLNN